VKSRSPELSEVLEGVRESGAADIRSCCIARVVRWDVATPREVDVQPVHKRAYTDETGVRVPDKQPVIPSVPLVYPGGAGLVVTWPMAIGDEVVLVFSDDSLDKYLAGAGGDIDPEDDRHHHLADAIAIAGVRSLNAATSVSGTAVQIGTNGGAFQGAALGADLKTWLDGLRTTYNAHTHADPVSGNTGTPSGTILNASPAASATVKVTP
jgi:hypothetical protein